MALRNILKDGDPALLKKSREIKDFNNRLHILLDDMRETLTEANGLGLAAPQVGVLRRVALVVDMPVYEEPDSDNDNDNTDTSEVPEPEEADSETESVPIEEQIIELINPELIYEDGEQSGSEGCLSLPGLYGLVTRPQTVRVKAQDRFGNEFEMEASDLTARAVCHEIDHLNGVIFTSIAERMLNDEEVEAMRNPEPAEECEDDQ